MTSCLEDQAAVVRRLSVDIERLTALDRRLRELLESLDAKIEQLRERIETLVREREDERRFCNTAIANHLAEIERLKALGVVRAGPIATAKRENAKDILIWHGRWNVGAWFDHWPYDQRHPRAETDGGWVIGGGYVVEPKFWLPLPDDPC